MPLEDALTYIACCLARGATGPEERQTLKIAEQVVLKERNRIMREEAERKGKGNG